MEDCQITWRGFFHNHTGYARATRGYVLALDKLGVDVRIEPAPSGYAKLDREEYLKLAELQSKPLAENKKKILVVHYVPPEGLDWDKERSRFDYIVFNTVFEPYPIHREWVPVLNRADAVWLPSCHNREIFSRSGVEAPIYIIPHGVDLDVFNPAAGTLSLGAGDRFYFLAVAMWGSYRKALRELLEVYWQEFEPAEKVCLVLKTSTFWFGGRQELLSDLVSFKRSVAGEKAAPVLLCLDSLDNHTLARLYNSCYCYVLPSRGEGVGLPYMEAMACKKPCIATGWGGQTDFINESNGYLLDYKLQPVDMNYRESQMYFKDYMQLAEPDKEHLARLMRRAFTSRDEVRQKGEQAYREMQKWTWESSARKILTAVQDLISPRGGDAR